VYSGIYVRGLQVPEEKIWIYFTFLTFWALRF
jgi:hypothetical protein